MNKVGYEFSKIALRSVETRLHQVIMRFGKSF